MRETENKINDKVEELIIQTDLKTFLNDVIDKKLSFRLGEPWKYSEDSLGVVVPILRDRAPDRQYITMYEVLKQLNIKDTGSISQVELQNSSGMAIFVRAGTIFTGKTQNRAAQHSGIYQGEDEIVKVCCVHASHGITRGSKMEFGDIAPASVTINLMTGNQSGVWDSVRNFTGGNTAIRRHGHQNRYSLFSSMSSEHSLSDNSGESSDSHAYSMSSSNRTRSKGVRLPIKASHMEDSSEGVGGGFLGMSVTRLTSSDERGTDNLLGHLQSIKKGQSVLDDMMQKVPLFPDQVGAIIFNPAGVIAVETFDHPKSWAAIKKEIVEKYGDKIKEKQAEHLFELKPEVIPRKLKEFIGKLDKFTETTIKKDNFSETREIRGDGIIGEYTLVKGQPIHVLLLKEEKKYEEDNT